MESSSKGEGKFGHIGHENDSDPSSTVGRRVGDREGEEGEPRLKKHKGILTDDTCKYDEDEEEEATATATLTRPPPPPPPPRKTTKTTIKNLSTPTSAKKNDEKVEQKDREDGQGVDSREAESSSTSFESSDLLTNHNNHNNHNNNNETTTKTMMTTTKTMMTTSRKSRWRTHQMAEDYVSVVGNLMYPGKVLGYGHDPLQNRFPLERMTTLGYLTSPLRRPSVIETWSPYEISVFEASITLYGKNFHQISKLLKNKNTKQVIEFYYIWKKTSHGKKWKSEYIPATFDSDEDEVAWSAKKRR